jgi:hypothetical protein
VFVNNTNTGGLKITDYSGEFFYQGNASGDTLKFINHEEGRTLMTTSVPAYEYFLKDHLGNTRVSFKAITETTEYKTDFEAGTNSTFGNYTAGVRSPMNFSPRLVFRLQSTIRFSPRLVFYLYFE